METQRIHSGHRQPPSPDTGFNLNINHNKEPMFEKPLTPSDVGKLNRLVIPKQHAEKYFPITGAGGGDTGDLLSFEDESGTLWRFRYSYWNSSQSYVLTKGWSRYVKEKRLDPGDVVSFERDGVDCERMFIGWRRRCAAVPAHDSAAVDGGAQVIGWHGRMFYNAQANYPSHHMPLSLSLQLPYRPDCFHAGGMYENVENYQRGPRQVRLFGVNLECPDESEPSTPDGSSHDEGSQPHHQYMTINFNEMRYHHHHHG